ncbi:MAG: hypothetical protein FJ060_07460 [Cyanobacteria bacterium K_Offshore_0m_m2_072]|nr:hypothetical protein [Cyanobacteria bacterium K_Offshore_0m_m2_072]
MPPRNAEALRLAIVLLLLQPQLARAFGKAARARVAAEFQVDLVNQRTLDQYHQLLSQPLDRGRGRRGGLVVDGVRAGGPAE